MDVTEHLLDQGVSTMVVQCPSFVFDCLETLEEVGQELREHFLKNGGKEFILVPALNHSPEWLKVLKCMILEQVGVKYETCTSTETAATQRSDSPFSL
jgi:ferrochelatase